MAILRLSGTKQGSKAFIGIKQQGSKEATPIIDPETKKPVTQIKARVIGAKVDEFTFEWEVNHSLSLVLESGNKRHYFNLGYSFLAISIYNSILGMTPDQLEEVSISVYQGKDDGKNKVYVTSRGDKVEWAIQKEQLDTLVDTTKDKKGNVVATDKILLTQKFQELTATKQFPKALVQTPQKNALDFLDDLPAMDNQTAEATEVFNSPPPKKHDNDEIHIDDIPW